MVVVSCFSYQQIKQNEEFSDLVLENMEALADNESESELDCDGWLGICSFKCDKCGTDWSAIGSTMLGEHTCKQ